MTKIEKVIKFIRQDGKRKKNYTFTWEEFNRVMKCRYPSAETNYLSMLVLAGYVSKPSRGKYKVDILPGFGINTEQLKWEAYSPAKRREVKVQFGTVRTKLKLSKEFNIYDSEYNHSQGNNGQFIVYDSGEVIKKQDDTRELILCSMVDRLVFKNANIDDFHKLREIYEKNGKLKITIEEV